MCGSVCVWFCLRVVLCVCGSVCVCVRLSVSLQACLFQVVGYRALLVEVEKLRRENYDSENLQHEDMLLRVCTC